MIQQCIVGNRVSITSSSTIYNILLQVVYKLEYNKMKWQGCCEQKRLQAQKRYKNSKRAPLKKLYTNADYFGVLNP